MPAVVRVKRRIDEEPLSSFVLNGKRRRVEDENDSTPGNKEELSTLLKFAGTITEQDNSATTQFARLSKEEAKELVMQKSNKTFNATEKSRQEMRKNQHEQRFRVVNCLRTTLDEDTNDSTKSKEITIVDIEKNVTNDKTADTSKSLTTIRNINSTEASTSSAAAAAASAVALPMTTDSDTGYVYDLYIPDNEQHADYVDQMDDNYLSVKVSDDLIYEDCYNNDCNDDEYDSEDSNQENYFTNEYPDEDEFDDLYSDRKDEYEEQCSKHLRMQVESLMFNDDDEENDSEYNESSSDDEYNSNTYRDPYVHSIHPEEEGFCYDVDSCDVERYGLAYARYKARVLNKIKPESDDDYNHYEEDDDSQ